jgi:hypothetical protein
VLPGWPGWLGGLDGKEGFANHGFRAGSRIAKESGIDVKAQIYLTAKGKPVKNQTLQTEVSTST